MCRILYGSSDKPSTKEFISNFDLILGSGTGGLTAVGLLSGKSIDEIAESYLNICSDVFSGNKYIYTPIRYLRYIYSGNFYDQISLQDIIERDYSDGYMFSLSVPRVCVTLSRDHSIFLSRSYTNTCNSISGTSSMTVGGTLVSTCTNTDYFLPTSEGLSDSTIECPNPSEVSLIEAHDIFKSGYPYLLLSIGTGVPDFDDDDIESEIVHQRTLCWCIRNDVSYFRFNPPKVRSISDNEYRDFVLENGEIITSSYMDSLHEDIIRFKKIFMSDLKID